jgi:uncharacterized membrane protein YbhN (UPF0104 family)
VTDTPPSSIDTRRADGRWRRIGVLLGGIIFAAMVVYLGRAVASGDVSFERLRGPPLVLAFLLLLGSQLAQAAAWHVLLRAAGGTASFSVDAGRWSVSLVGKYVPGKVFNALARLLLYRGSALGAATLTGTYGAEFMLSMTAAVCVAAATLSVAGDSVPPAVTMALIACAVGAAIITFSALFDRSLAWLAARVMRVPVPLPVPLRPRVVAFCWEVAAYVLMGVGLFSLASAFETTSWSLIPVFIGALCLSGVAGILAFFVPAGLGVREGALAYMLSMFVTPGFAALVAVACRIWLTAGDAIAVAIGAAVLRGRGRE